MGNRLHCTQQTNDAFPTYSGYTFLVVCSQSKCLVFGNHDRVYNYNSLVTSKIQTTVINGATSWSIVTEVCSCSASKMDFPSPFVIVGQIHSLTMVIHLQLTWCGVATDGTQIVHRCQCIHLSVLRKPAASNFVVHNRRQPGKNPSCDLL